jgi:CO dehydrogenase/acetyl-CoA synthase epsilon subunit
MTKVVIIEYATIAPTILEMIVKQANENVMCVWKDLDEDFYEFAVYGDYITSALEDTLAAYV